MALGRTTRVRSRALEISIVELLYSAVLLRVANNQLTYSGGLSFLITLVQDETFVVHLFVFCCVLLSRHI